MHPNLREDLKTTFASERERDRTAARVLRSYLDGRHLPPYEPGEASRMAAMVAANQAAPAVLDALADIYEVAKWDLDTFERVVLGRAFRAWHRQFDLHREPGSIVAEATDCPVIDSATQDARVCQMCQAVQSQLAARATGGAVEEVRFYDAIAKGGQTCRIAVRLKQR